MQSCFPFHDLITEISIGVLLVYGSLAVLLNRFFRSFFHSFFSKYIPPDEAVNRDLSRHALRWALLCPLMAASFFLWVKFILGKGIIFGVRFPALTGLFFLIVQWTMLLEIFSTLRLFSRCYSRTEGSRERPIRTIIVFLYSVLVILGMICTISVISRERPIVILSTFGAAAALFVFAFQNLISSMVASVQVNAEKIVKVGDWIVIADHDIDGIVEQISPYTIKIRSWNMSLVSFPIRLLLDETLVNYESMLKSGARRIKLPLRIDQRTIRFLQKEDLPELKQIPLVTEEMLKSAEETSAFRTNLEAFVLYAEKYLLNRADICHDRKCLIRVLAPDAGGLPLEIYCYSAKTSFVDFEKVQRSVLFHLEALLPAFHLRVFQRSSDAAPSDR